MNDVIIEKLINEELTGVNLEEISDPEELSEIIDRIVYLVTSLYPSASEGKIVGMIKERLVVTLEEPSMNKNDPAWIAKCKCDIDKTILDEIILKGISITEFYNRFKNKGDIDSLVHMINERVKLYKTVLQELSLDKYGKNKKQFLDIIDYVQDPSAQKLGTKRYYIGKELGDKRICHNGKYSNIVDRIFDGKKYVASFVIAGAGVRFERGSMDMKLHGKNRRGISDFFSTLAEYIKEEQIQKSKI